MTDQRQLLAAVSGRTCETYADVLKRLDDIDSVLDVRDGLRWFNRLYHAMTEAVAKHASRGAFHDAQFLQTLDCAFAELYFSAVRAHLTRPGSEPRAWTPLFAARGTRGLAPLQLAIAGVNAHINRDLVVALGATFARLGGEPNRASAQHADYLHINAILAEVQVQAKAFLFSARLAELDEDLGSVDDFAELWSLERARDAAWTGCEVQWQLRGLPELAEVQLNALDRLVGCTGRCLLQPLQSVMRA